MSRRLLLFVHGLGGHAETTWGKFPQLVREDRDLAPKVDVGTYAFPTMLFRLPFGRKALKIQTLASGLRTQIENQFSQYDWVMLVCHSLGGLIARRYLLDEVKSQRSLRCTQLLLFAVPNNGAGLASVGKYISWKHYQVQQLCADSDLVEDLNDDWFRFDMPRKLLIKYVLAGQDRIVTAQSAKSYWGNSDVETVVNKDHRSLVKPDGPNDLAFLILKLFIERTIATGPTASAADAGQRAQAQEILFLAADAGLGLQLAPELERIAGSHTQDR